MTNQELLTELEEARKRIAGLETQLGACLTPEGALQELIFETAPGGMAIVSFEGRIILANHEVAEILAIDPSELLGYDIRPLYVDEDHRLSIRKALFKGLYVKNNELQLKRTDGQIVWLNLNARLISFKGEDVALVAFSDITSLKEVQEELHEAREDLERQVTQRTAELEKANAEMGLLNIKLVKKSREREQDRVRLKQSEELFRSLFEDNHGVMLLINPSTGQIVDANNAAARFYGYDRDLLQSMRIDEINTMSPKEVRDEMNLARKQQRNHFHFRHRLADGSIRDVEVFSGPVMVKQTQLLYSIVHDVTKRRVAEDKLRQYERVIQSTPDLVALVDKDYFFRMVNDSYVKHFGKPLDEIMDHSVEDLLGREYFESHSKPNLDRAFLGETVKTEFITENTQGPVHLDVTFNPVTGLTGSIDYVAIDARDITDLKEKEEMLQATAERLDLATNAGRIGIFEMEVQTGEYIWDHMMFQLYGLDPQTFSGKYEAWQAMVHPDDLSDIEGKVTESLANKSPIEGEFRIVRPDGEIRHIHVSALIQTDQSGEPTLITGVNTDITATRKLEEKLRKLATTDALTDANNRRHFMERGAEEFERARRYNTPTSMLTLDIDHFKRINDTYGHPVGDEVLKSLVRICKATLRTTDIFARMGGEEFSALLPETSLQSGIKTAERLREAVAEDTVKTAGHDITYTISLGVSIISDDDTSIEDVMRRADEALYQAKERGRNRVEKA